MRTLGGEWIDAKESARRLGVTASAVRRLASAGGLGVRAVRFARRAYLAKDVDRLAASAVRPATADLGGAS